MAVVARVAQILLGLVAALFALAFVVAMGSTDTGPVEKSGLLVMAALSVGACIAVPRLVRRRRSRGHLS